MKPLTVEERHPYFLGIANAIHKHCMKYGIKYFIAYGTLLGAARHKGFIPWDDDFDVMMMREDYEKFAATFQDDRYVFLDCHNSKRVQSTFGRVCDSKTCMVAHRGRTITGKPILKPGLFVDIYVIENISSNKDEQMAFIKKVKRFNFILKWFIRLKKVLRVLRCINVKDDFAPLTYYLRKMQNVEKSYSKPTGYGICFAGRAADETVLDMSLFEDVIEMPFEDLVFCAPARYEDILTQRYGNWRKLPPVEEQCATHGVGYCLLD